jgi:hypothetical protein
MTVIGKIVKSNSHIDYVCQVFGAGERQQVPAPADYAFGRFVRVEVEGDDADLIGVIYNTILMNPEFGSLGPRLSSKSELEIFSPDYLNEKATLVGIFMLGSLPHRAGAPAQQGIPPIGAAVDAPVIVLTADELRRFHAGPPAPRLAYLPHLLSQANPLVPHLVLNILDQIGACYPDHEAELAVLRGNLAWRTQVQQAG